MDVTIVQTEPEQEPERTETVPDVVVSAVEVLAESAEEHAQTAEEAAQIAEISSTTAEVNASVAVEMASQAIDARNETAEMISTMLMRLDIIESRLAEREASQAPPEPEPNQPDMSGATVVEIDTLPAPPTEEKPKPLWHRFL